jgi:hypothetical protein
MTKLRGRLTKPESYIRAYRKALADAAIGIDSAARRGLRLTGRVRFDQADKAAARLLKEAVDAGKTPRDESRFGEERAVVEFNLADKTDAALWFRCQHGVGWNNVEVSGPGEI